MFWGEGACLGCAHVRGNFSRGANVLPSTVDNSAADVLNAAPTRRLANSRARYVLTDWRLFTPHDSDSIVHYVAARRHICFCFMAKSAFWRGFSALAPYTGVGPI